MRRRQKKPALNEKVSRLFGRRRRWLVIIGGLILGGPISAVAAFFIWRTGWSEKAKLLVTILATIIINVICLWVIGWSSKVLVSYGRG